MMEAANSPKRGAVALLLVAALCGATGHCQSMQWWPEVDLSLTAKRANLLIPSLARLDSNLPNPQFVATGAIGTIHLNRRWSLSAGYLFADLPQHDQVAHVPLAALTPSWMKRKWTFSDINRFERLLAYPSQPYRYRNRATADYAFGRHGTRHLYASNEFFVNLSERSWNQNRAELGVGIMAGHCIRFDAYFLERSAPGGKETSVVGTILTVFIHKQNVR